MTSEYEAGREAAKREIRDDRWTPEMAQRYLAAIQPLAPGGPLAEFDRGFTDAVRALAEGVEP